MWRRSFSTPCRRCRSSKTGCSKAGGRAVRCAGIPKPCEERHMKIAVIGAGAVGCFYGGMLARAGQDVVLIGRPRHVDAIRARGLRFESRLFDEQVTIAASANAASVEDADI